MREPCEGKLSRTVLRREGARKGSDLSDTVGKNAKKIQEYIQNQIQSDLEYDQMSLKEYIDPFTGEPVVKGK
ncbi:MAG TPA: hypothetical protein VGC17_07685 [Lactovum miscens]